MSPLRLLLAVALAVAATGCADETERKAGHLASARDLIRSGQLGEAQIELQNALKLDPNDAEVSRELGQLLRSGDQIDEAIFYFREAVRLDPELTDAQLGLAQLLRSRDQAEARALVETVLEREPENVRALVLLSDVELLEGNVAEAIAAARAAVELAPEQIPAQLRLGRALQVDIVTRQGRGETIPDADFEAAQQVYRKAVALSGKRPSALTLKAWLAQADLFAAWPGHAKQAAGIYYYAEVSLRSSPRMLATLLGHGVRYARANPDAEGSRELLVWAEEQRAGLEPGGPAVAAEPDAGPAGLLEEAESPERYRLLADGLTRVGRRAKALEAVERGLALAGEGDPERAQLLLVRARVESLSGDHAQANRSFASVLETEGEIPLAYRGDFARSLYEEGHKDAARKALASLVDQPGATPEAFALYAAYLEDPKAGRKVLDRGLAAHPSSPKLVGLLASAELNAGRAGAALIRTKKAAAKHPEEPRLRFLYGTTLARVGKPDKAIETLRALLAERADVEGVDEFLHLLLRQQEREDEVRAELRERRSAGALSGGEAVLLARLLRPAIEDAQEQELIDVLGEITEQDGAPVATKNDLAFLLAKRGEDLPRASRLAQEARRARPDSSQIADTLGFVLMKRGRYDRALAQLDAAVELAPESSAPWATAQFHRGQTLLAMERRDQAALAVERALAAGASFPEIEEARAFLAQLEAS